MLEKFAQKRILIVGDVMLDRYLWGKVSRISPEAPVPVVHHQQTENRLGGAANVALNVKALGAVPILCSVVGNDEDGRLFSSILNEAGISTQGMRAAATRCTTVKTRILAQQQQMLRIDHEDTHPLDIAEAQALYYFVEELLRKQQVDALIFQDYDKGVLVPDLIQKLITTARHYNIPTTADPKKQHFFDFKGVTLFKPNLKEIRDSLSFSVQPTVASLHTAANHLHKVLQAEYSMVTLSEKGLFVQHNAEMGHLYPTQARTIADVSGAGDTVISVATLGLAAGLPMKDIAALCNLAGGQVCEVPGVVPVNPALLEREWTLFNKQGEMSSL